MGFFDIFKKKNTEIKRVRFLFDYCSNNIFFYNSDDEMLSWGDSLIPPDWQKDDVFMNLNKKLCNKFDALYSVANKVEFIGFDNEEEKAEFVKLVDEFVNYVIKKCDGKYEISNDYDVKALISDKIKLTISCDACECLWGPFGGFKLPSEWKKDKIFMDLYNRMCGVYMSLFVNNEKEFYYRGFKDEQHKQETKELFDSFTAYINKINNGQYEIINCLDKFIENS